MDEILIEDKKYISSKQAAKVTGYAKDYIGQLCREGRVPARLVGRSWYVLESAIADHRFGNPVIDNETSKKTKDPSPMHQRTLQSTWESPRYESSPVEILPSVNRLSAESTDNQEEGYGVSQEPLEDSWQEWFKRFDKINTESIAVTTQKEEKEHEVEEQTKEVQIPIHAIHHAFPKEVPQRNVKERQIEQQELPIQEEIRHKKEKGIMKVIQIIAVSLAAITFIIAVIGTGYFDKYIVSSKRASIITGILLYNK